MTAPHPQQNKGFILVTVLLLVTLLTALLLRFHRSASADLQATQNRNHRLQALNAARAALHIAFATINKNDNHQTNNTLQSLLNQTAYFDFGPAHVTLDLDVENGKINVNRLNDPNGDYSRPRIQQMLRLIDLLNQQRPQNTNVIPYALVPALLDWTDPDNTPTVLPFIQGPNAGAESPYYRRQHPPYAATNRPFATLDELLLVKGFTPELLYGTDHTNSSTSQPTSHNTTPLPANHTATLAPNLSRYLTIYGDGKIDLNNAPPLILQTLLPNLDPALARQIVNQRRLKPFSSPADLAALPGLDLTANTHLAEIATVAPQQQYCRVTAHAAVQHTTVTLTAVTRKNTNSPNLDILAYWES